MKTTLLTTTAHTMAGAALALTMVAMSASAVQAANECRVQYSYKTSGGSTKTKTTNLNAGQTRTYNKNRMRYIKNRKNAPVRIKITNVIGVATVGTKNITLPVNNTRDPASGSYASNPKTKMYTIKCLASASSASSGGGFGSPAALINALKNSTPVKEIMKKLSTVFNKSKPDIARLMRQANFSRNIVAKGLKDAFNASTNQIANWMKAGGFSGADIVKGLKGGLNVSLNVAAAAMKPLNYTGKTLWGWLKTTYSASDRNLAKAFKAAGYSWNQITGILRAVGKNATAAATVLKQAITSLTRPQCEQFLKAAQYTTSQVNAALNAVFGQVRRTVRAVGRSAAGLSAHALYDTYFRLVKAGAGMRRINGKMKAALIAAGVNRRDVQRVKIGYSAYLAKSTGGKVAMTDCNNIYFPRQDVVSAIAQGTKFRNHWWLLHEMGHTKQCREGGRQGFATRWFSELNGTVKGQIAAGKTVNGKTIHDAMPLERQADAYANKHRRAFESASAK